MKYIFILTILILSSNSLYACLSASQNRIYPLGTTKQGLCVVETRLTRTEFRGPGVNEIKMIPSWVGVSYFKIYDAKYKEIRCDILDTIKLFKEQFYDSIIGISLNNGLLKAEKLPNFVKAKPISLLFCDFQEKCSKAEILYDTITNTISIKLPNKSTHKLTVLFDSSSIASNIIEMYTDYEDADPISAKLLMGELSLSSVRQYSIGGKKLTVVHIGAGQGFEYLEGEEKPVSKEYQPKTAYNDIYKSVFIEPVIHHGHGFDFFILE